MWRIRYFFDSIRNLVIWFPVIWKDRDWDQYFLYRIMLVKIQHMRKRNERIRFYVGHDIDAKWMRICERLIENLTENNYWLDEYDNKPINYRNMNATYEEVSMAQVRLCKEDGMFYKKGEDLGSGHRAELRERKAKALLFKILSWRIDYWWD